MPTSFPWTGGSQVSLQWGLVIVVFAMLCLRPSAGFTEDAQVPSKWIDVPDSNSRLQPAVEVREHREMGQHRIAVVVRFRGCGQEIFNPFGIEGYGRPYSIILSDLEMIRTWPIVESTEARFSVPPSKAWVRVTEGGVIGRAFWIGETSHNAQSLIDDNKIPWDPPLPGKYLLHVIVQKRMDTSSPFSDSEQLRVREQKKWVMPEGDEIGFRSRPLEVAIGQDGTLRPSTGQRQTLEEVEVIPQNDSEGKQELLFMLCPPKPRSIHAPFMFKHFHIFGPLRLRIDHLNGTPIYDYEASQAKTFGHAVGASIDYCVGVPVDGIVGSPIRMSKPLLPETYKLTAEVTEAIDRDWLFAPIDLFHPNPSARVPKVILQNRRQILRIEAPK